MARHVGCGGNVGCYHDGYHFVLFCEKCNIELDEAHVKEEGVE